MSDFLDRTAARALAPVPAIRPRLGSPYEPGPEAAFAEVPSLPAEIMDKPMTLEKPSIKPIAETLPLKARSPSLTRAEETRTPALAKSQPYKQTPHAEDPDLPEQDSLIAPIPTAFQSKVDVSILASLPKDLPKIHIRSTALEQDDFRERAAGTSPSTPAPEPRDEVLAPIVKGAEGSQGRASNLPAGERTRTKEMRTNAGRLNVQPVPLRRSDTAVLSRAEPEKPEMRVEPAIHVTIGRVEIRAITPPARAPAVGGIGRQPMSLDDYLKRTARRSS